MPRPIRDRYTIPYGAQFGAMRAGGARTHLGTDYHCPVWTPIYGVADGGRVAHIGANMDPWMGLGHNITIVYPGGVQTLDAHMVNRTPLAYGQTVNSDTVIGYVGQTGNAVNASPPGPHLHHERRHHGVLVDPESIYRTEPAGGGTPIEEEDDMPTYELVKAANSITVWFCVDRLHRYAIPSEMNLADYVNFIKSKGQDATIKQVALRSFGAPIYEGGFPSSAQIVNAMKPTVPTAEQIAAEVAKLIPTVELEAGDVDVPAIATAVADELANRLS